MLTQEIRSMHPQLDIRELFDPVQTHAVYNVSVNAVDALKAQLKETVKATRFRIVKPRIEGIVILCFKVKN